MKKYIYILYDGSNLFTRRVSKKEKVAFKKDFKSLQRFNSDLIQKFKRIIPLIFVDYSLKYIIDDRDWLEQEIKVGRIFEAEIGHEADEYLIGFLKVLPLRILIVSNDKFRDHQKNIPLIYEGILWLSLIHI